MSLLVLWYYLMVSTYDKETDLFAREREVISQP